MQTKLLLTTLLLGATPALFADDMLADDVLEMDARIELGRELFFQVGDDTAALVQAETSDEKAAAVVRLESARDRGSAVAAHQLAYAYFAGRFGLTSDLDQARRNYELAVSQELPFALWEYGLLLHTGNRFPVDTGRGLTLINRAAELSFPPAIAFLVSDLRETGVEADTAKADAWYKSLGMFGTEVALGIDGDPLQRAQQYAYGQADIYALYREGVLLAKNQQLADVWFKKINPAHLAIALDSVAVQLSSRTNVRSDQHLAASLQQIAISHDDSDPTVINNHAWLLATANSADLRDGVRAVQIMEELFSRVEEQGFMIDTLAAAYAEVGDFDAAVAEQERANAWFAAESQDFAVGIEHLDAYTEGHAWRD